MGRAIAALLFGACFVLSVGCGKYGPPQAPVKGKVTLDGHPLPEGEITFLVSGNAPTILPIKDGEYQGKAVAGKNRVEIRAFVDGPPLSTEPNGPPTKLNYLPDRFSGHSKLQANVVAKGANDFSFPITSR